jgi:hypothetical protein
MHAFGRSVCEPGHRASVLDNRVRDILLRE